MINVSKFKRHVRFPKYQTEEIQIKAVKQDARLIEYLNKPSMEVLKLAIELYPHALFYICNIPKKKISNINREEFLWEAVKINPSCLIYICNPNEDLVLHAIRNGLSHTVVGVREDFQTLSSMLLTLDRNWHVSAYDMVSTEIKETEEFKREFKLLKLKHGPLRVGPK